MLSVQSAQRAYRSPPQQRAPRGVRDPWVIVGGVVALAVTVGWVRNPALPGSTTDLPLRVAQLVLAAAPVLLLVAWLCAVLRTRVGGTTAWPPSTLVAIAGVWVLVLTTVLVLHGAENAACAGLIRCATSTADRVALGSLLVALWVGARLVEGAFVLRRAGATSVAPPSAG
jgi:hypothetical protein